MPSLVSQDEPSSDEPSSASPSPPEDGDPGVAALAHIMAHRLGSLVSTIETYTDLLIDALEAPDQRAMALSIFEASENIDRILADMKRYAQTVEPVSQSVRLDTLARALPPFFGAADAGRLTLEIDAPEERTFSADPVLLRQALMVLLQNAFDATQAPAPVRLRASFEGARVRLAVWNEGAIEEAETARKLFQPFFTTKARNLGVGLPLARRIAEAHGGTLRLAANSAEEGTRFELLVPEDSAGRGLTLQPRPAS